MAPPSAGIRCRGKRWSIQGAQRLEQEPPIDQGKQARHHQEGTVPTPGLGQPAAEHRAQHHAKHRHARKAGQCLLALRQLHRVADPGQAKGKDGRRSGTHGRTGHHQHQQAGYGRSQRGDQCAGDVSERHHPQASAGNMASHSCMAARLTNAAVARISSREPPGWVALVTSRFCACIHHALRTTKNHFVHNALLVVKASDLHNSLRSRDNRRYHVKTKPLAGIRVLEVGAYISAPYAGVILGALGAEVVKVEPPAGEAFRRGEDNRNAYFIQYNSGKKSVAIDLKRSSGVELVKSLVPRFDVLIENMRPGKMSALGLGEDVCRALHPGLIYASISGFGSGGPWVDRPAYDTIGQSIGGIYSVMNDAGHARLTGTCVADLITGVGSAMGILAALLGRERSADRKGTLLETSLHEAVSLITIDAMTQAYETGVDPVRNSRHPQAQNFCLNCADGGAITVHLSVSQKFWANLARLIGRPELIDDPRYRTFDDRRVPAHYEELVRIMEDAFRQKPRAEWERLLVEADVPFAPVLTMHEVFEHEQTQWLGLMGPMVQGLPMVRPPWRFDGDRPERSELRARVGQHTREVLSEVCAEADLEALIACGDVAVPA
jgi:crotonobetainyl-CoA:carnitine CoA-transferase CaiB-like acyl-CoA transferase